MYERIRKLAKILTDQITQFTRELIAIPSMDEDNEIIARIKQEMKSIGYKNIHIDNMGNLRGKIGSGKKLLALDGHVDTVKIGNLMNWKYDPFKGKHENNIIYGRGAADQKGGLASAIYAGSIINEIGIPEDSSYMVVASVEEENYEGLNWQYLIKEEKIIPNAIILTEPSNLNIMLGHRGRADIKIEVMGRSSHGANPDLGENAIYKILPIIQEIEKIHKGLSEDPIFGKGSISVTNINSSAPAINAIPDSASILIDRRLNKNDSLNSILNELKDLNSVKRAKADVYIMDQEFRRNNLIFHVESFYPAWTMELSDPLIKTAINAYKAQFKTEPLLRYWRFSTNGAATKGIFNIPTFGFGPGNDLYAHTNEDQVSIDHLIRAMEFYSSFAFQWG